jgi:hypothetical protein
MSELVICRRQGCQRRLKALRQLCLVEAYERHIVRNLDTSLAKRSVDTVAEMIRADDQRGRRYGDVEQGERLHVACARKLRCSKSNEVIGERDIVRRERIAIPLDPLAKGP